MKDITKWSEWPHGEVVDTAAETVAFNSEDVTRIYWREFDDTPEILVGSFLGEKEFMLARGKVRYESDGRVWVYGKAAQQVRTHSGEKFTTLDRPAELSPEMQAIQRMERRNAIEREKTYQQIERLVADNDRLRGKSQRADSVADTQNAVEETAATSGKKPVRSKGDTAKSESKADNQQADDTGVSGRKDSGDDSGAESDETSG